jgi:hypothetical protein
MPLAPLKAFDALPLPLLEVSRMRLPFSTA